MKKRLLIALAFVITLSFCGCNTPENMIGTKHGTAYFNKPENNPEIVYRKTNDMNDKETKLEDDSFCDKLIAVIDGKASGNEFCNCEGDYVVTIDNNYTFRLHTDKIVIFSNTKEFDGFTVECSEAEMKELYDIIESAS